ncbi:MAG TPA: hypothetical protein PLE45_05985 [Spirochaetota bacterium]|nr:hypothetical protein [Spirochaetota bacterium]HOL56776.1 hypothetical protein [Spirochaetota bacterium]HPP04243.1 hypothetical protein [Spirochaetota bacterium]
MNKKIVFIIFCLFLFTTFFNGIDEKLYKNLTDRDRILLAISYYEVGKKYEALGKTDLAKAYLNDAFKIEKNVDKYAKGELEIPPKVIQIQWDKIFEEEQDKDKTLNKTKEQEEKKNSDSLNKEKSSISDEDAINELVEIFFKYINSYDSFNISNLFTDEVLIESVDIYIAKYEIKESFEGFFNAKYNKKYKFDSLKIEKVDENSFIVNIKIIKEEKDFFIFPSENGYVKLGVIKENNRYLFNKIFGSFADIDDKDNTQSKIEKYDTPEKILTGFIDLVIKKDYESASFFFNEEV